MQEMDVYIEEVKFSYPKRPPLFENFEFHAAAKHTILRGPSGCGKTTLLKLLAGFLSARSSMRWSVPDAPYLVLQTDSLPPWLSPIAFLQTFGPHKTERVRRNPMFPFIEDFWSQSAHRLSYGQRRTFELICAFESDNNLVLLDEPFNYLDRERRSAFVSFLNFRDKPNQKVILTTHFDDESKIDSSEIFEFAGSAPFSCLHKVTG